MALSVSWSMPSGREGSCMPFGGHHSSSVTEQLWGGTEPACKLKCLLDIDCTAYEYGSIGRYQRCALHRSRIDRTMPVAGMRCFVKTVIHRGMPMHDPPPPPRALFFSPLPKPSFAPLLSLRPPSSLEEFILRSFYLASNTEGSCRTRFDTAGAFEPRDLDLHGCYQECLTWGSCYAFEFSEMRPSYRCELHTEAITKIFPLSGFFCYVKPFPTGHPINRAISPSPPIPPAMIQPPPPPPPWRQWRASPPPAALLWRPTVTQRAGNLAPPPPPPKINACAKLIRPGMDLRGCGDLKGADLRGANLTGAILDGLDMSGAKFAGAYLMKASMQSTICQSTDFTGAHMKSAYLQYSDLSSSNFNRAGLELADFTGAILDNADFSHANLWRVKLTIIYDARQVRFDFANLEEASVTDCHFPGASFISTKLTKAAMEDVLVPDSFFLSTRFDGVAFIDASLSGAHLADCVFDGANMDHARFFNANLQRASFRGTMLAEGQMQGANCEGADFTDAVLNIADFSRADVRDSSFRNAKLTDAVFIRTKVERADFSDAIDLVKVDFAGATGVPLYFGTFPSGAIGFAALMAKG